ncbi:MAG: hypothetical protein OHK0023_12030 [Anaerolineae bacterium]
MLNISRILFRQQKSDLSKVHYQAVSKSGYTHLAKGDDDAETIRPIAQYYTSISKRRGVER